MVIIEGTIDHINIIRIISHKLSLICRTLSTKDIARFLRNASEIYKKSKCLH